MTTSLDNAATAFEDNPSPATAKIYETLAIHYAATMVISVAELGNILELVRDWIEPNSQDQVNSRGRLVAKRPTGM